jgi:hypothetical protein
MPALTEGNGFFPPLSLARLLTNSFLLQSWQLMLLIRLPSQARYETVHLNSKR